MKLNFNYVRKYVIFSLVMSFFTFIIFEGHRRNNAGPNFQTLNENTIISKTSTVSDKKVIRRSRDSSVRVLSFDFNTGMMATSSATYFTHNKKYYVLTTSHGLVAGCVSIQIEAAGELYDCLKVVKKDDMEDYAILEIEKIYTRQPIEFPKHFVSGVLSWKKALSLVNGVIYTGYPNSIGPLTVHGTIMGYNPQGLIYVQSYAWSGSSGSGIFDDSGRLLGYILAIDVGQTEFGAAVLENVMIVVPIYKVDWSIIYGEK